MNETEQSLDTDYVEQPSHEAQNDLDEAEGDLDEDYLDEGEDDAAEQPDHPEQAAPLSPLSHLPITLTLRCGSLSLTIEELRRLDRGTVLEVLGVSPGHAALCHGEQVVAEGELVDVGGRLGLQITRMASLS